MNQKIRDFFSNEKVLSKIPFILLVLMFITPIVLLKINYHLGIFFIAFYVSYWTVRILQSYIYVLSSYFKLLWVWKKDFQNTEIMQNEAKKLKHIIIVPFYNEPYAIIEEAVQAIVDNKYPYPENISVLLAWEDRVEWNRELADKVVEKFKNEKIKIINIPHPDWLPWEWKVKGSNISYAVQEYIKWKNLNPHMTFVSTIDSDTRVDENFFAIATNVFLNTEKRDNAIYQYTPIYSNNWTRWRFFARLVAMWTTFWQLAETQNPEFYRNFAVYGQSLHCLVKSDYWSRTSIVEDWLQYWRSYFAFDWVFRIVNVPAVCKMDIVEEDNFVNTIKAQYKQLRRWSWGCTDYEFVIPKFISNHKIPRIDRVRKTIYLIFNHLFWSAWALMLFFIGYLPWAFWDRQAWFSNLAVPIWTSVIFTWIFFTIVIPSILSILIMRKYTHMRKRDFIFSILQWFAVPVFSLTLFSFPAIESQFRLFIGKRLDTFEVTKKIRN